jgi:cell division protein FtsN
VKAAAAAPPPASPAPVKTAAPAASSGAFVLQIGAYKSEADASAAWKAYQAKHATLLSGVSSSIQKADLGDKGVWYRLRAGSFADKDTAAALCERLKADGGACFPAK